MQIGGPCGLDRKTSMVARPQRFHELIRAFDRRVVCRRRSFTRRSCCRYHMAQYQEEVRQGTGDDQPLDVLPSRSPSGVSDRRPAETGYYQQLSLAFRYYPDEYQYALAGVSRRASKCTPSSHRYPCCWPDRRHLSRMSPSLVWTIRLGRSFVPHPLLTLRVTQRFILPQETSRFCDHCCRQHLSRALSQSTGGSTSCGVAETQDSSGPWHGLAARRICP